MHIWVADQAQSSAPAWLTSPAVVVLGFVATVISILQGLISTTRWFIVRTDKLSTRHRLTVSAVVCIIASIVVLAPFTWETMAREDVKAGSNPLWLAEMYPLTIFLPLIICVLFYLKDDDFNWKSRAAYFAFFMVAISLAFPTLLYDALNSSAWERYLVTATSALTLAMLAITHLAHILPRIKPLTDVDAQKPPA